MPKLPKRRRKSKPANPRHNSQEPKLPWPRIIIGIPMERTVPGKAFFPFLRIASQGWPILDVPYGRTDVVRNKMAVELLKTNATHLIMLDMDHVHPPDIVERLVRWVVADPTKQVVGGLNFRRGEPYEPCAFIFDSDGEAYAPVDWEPGLVRVDILGTGSILIAREVFERIPPPWFANDYQLAWEDTWPGEDVGFSKLCTKHGINLWLDTTSTSPHLIDGVVDESVYRRYLQDHPHRIINVDGEAEEKLVAMVNMQPLEPQEESGG